jgi:hypothetical protein
MKSWAKYGVILFWCFGLFGQAFAHLGVPSANLFVGDIVLGLFVVCCTGAILRPWLSGLVERTPFSEFYWMFLLVLFYAILESARGFTLEYSTVLILKTAVGNIYPLFFFLGLLMGHYYPDTMGKFVRVMVWVGCIYGLIYYPFQSHFANISLPGSTVPIFPAPGGGIAFLGLTYLGKDLRRWYFPLIVSLGLELAIQIRAEWVALSTAMILQSVLIKKVPRLLAGAAIVAGLLLVGYVTDFSIPSPAGRGGMVSSREIVGRAISAVDVDAGKELSNKASFYAGTVSWREKWWKAIWVSTNANTETALFGPGYGFPLADLVSYLRNMNVRTPHSSFYYALGYTGWVGVVLFYGMQAALGLTLFRAWKVSGQPYGIVFWLYSLVASCFGAFFDSPVAAIPFFLTTGMAAAVLYRVPDSVPEAHAALAAAEQIG